MRTPPPPGRAWRANGQRLWCSESSRYLVNGLREAFELPGTPIRLLLWGTKNPYE